MSEATFDPTRYNQSGNMPLSTILEQEVSRRSVLKSGIGLAALGVVGGFGVSACGGEGDNTGNGTVPPSVDSSTVKLGFDSIGGSLTDSVTVPEGYSAQVLAPWGTPLNGDAAVWKEDGSNTSRDQLNAVGMHHDGIRYFPLNNSSSDGVLCINHEFLDRNALHPNGPTEDEASGLRTIVEEVRKEINAHGVTVVRVRKNGSAWEVVSDDKHNRRLTASTDIDIAGPLAGHASLITPYSASGTISRGTLNNCGNGYTPWGTYLTCEENWPAYFKNLTTLTSDQARLGLSSAGYEGSQANCARSISPRKRRLWCAGCRKASGFLLRTRCPV